MLRPVDLRLVVVRIRDSLSYHRVVDIGDMLLESCHRQRCTPPQAIKLEVGTVGRTMDSVATIRLMSISTVVSISWETDLSYGARTISIS